MSLEATIIRRKVIAISDGRHVVLAPQIVRLVHVGFSGAIPGSGSVTINDADTNATDAWSSSKIAAEITASKTGIVAAAPASLDTLEKISAAIGGDTDFSGSVAGALAGKAAAVHDHPASAITDSTASGRAMLTAATTAAQTALLDVVTGGAKGLAPASGGGTTNFLRADNMWAVPAGGIADAPSNGTPHVRKDAAWLPVPQVAAYVKTADTTKTFNTTMANDPHLANIPLAANAIYKIEMQITANAGAVSDGKLQIVVQSGLAGADMKLAQDLANEISQYFTFAQVNAFSGAGAGLSRMGLYVGTISTAGASGTIALQWAQNTSSAEVTTFEKGSYIILTRLA